MTGPLVTDVLAMRIGRAARRMWNMQGSQGCRVDLRPVIFNNPKHRYSQSDIEPYEFERRAVLAWVVLAKPGAGNDSFRL